MLAFDLAMARSALCLTQFLLVLLSVAPASAAQPLELRDRILAVVDEDPILASDVDRAIILGFAERAPAESESAFRRRVLEAIVDQRVRLHEVSRFGVEQVPVAEIEQQVAAIRGRFASDEELRARLAEVGLDLTGLRQLVTQQLAVLRYLEEFLGPRIFVSLEDTRAYYDEVLVPALAAEGAVVPPIEDVREDIRALLQEQRLNEAIATRTEELRREADVVNYFDSDHRRLPEVILTLERDPGEPD